MFDPEWGHDLGSWLEQVNVVGEYMNNRHWNELCFRDSRERFADLRAWGVKFLEKDGEVVRLPHPYKNIDLPDKHKFPPIVSEVVHWLPSHTDPMRKHLIRSGVKLKDRFMVTELLKQEDRVVGAIGFSIEGNEPHVIRAKAVVLCAGGGGFRPIGYPTHEMTADGHVMAYRVGATITSKEFVAPHSTNPEQPAWPPMYLFFSSGGSAALPGMYQVPKLFNAEGDQVPARGMAWHGWLDAEYEAHEGRAPLIADMGRRGVHPVSGPGGHGSMLGHATGGVVPVDDDCSTEVPGLYAAGDSCGTCFIGASYSGFGFATMHAAATGARAGLGAAKEAKRLAVGGADRHRRPGRGGGDRAATRATGAQGRLHPALGHPGIAEHPGPVLRAVHQARGPPADRTEHGGVSARPYRAQALRPRRSRTAAGSRDQEHGHQRRDEAALVAVPHREPRHPLPRGPSRPQRRRVAGVGASQGGRRPDEGVQGAHPGRVAAGGREALRRAVSHEVAERVAGRRRSCGCRPTGPVAPASGAPGAAGEGR